MERVEQGLYLHSSIVYIGVTCTLDCRPPEDAEEFPKHFQPFSQIENAQEKARLRWKMQIVPVAFQFFWMIFALMTFQHATQAAFSLSKLRQSGQEKRWRCHWPQVCRIV